MANASRRTLLGATIAAAGTAGVTAPTLASEAGRWPAKPQPRPTPRPPGDDAKLLALCAEHRALAHEFIALVHQYDELSFDQQQPKQAGHEELMERNTDRAEEIEGFLADMTAHTPAGQAAQLRVAMRTLTCDPDLTARSLVPDTEAAWGILERLLAVLDAGALA
jgi:hypothetical protein